MKTLAVTNQKGGVGKTAVACHLAYYLRDEGHKVLFVDLDPQANASSTLQESACSIPTSALFDEMRPNLTAGDGITLVAADPPLVDIERADAAVVSHFRANMAALADQFDFAVIDTGPGKGLRMVAALVVADFALAPIELEAFSIQGITNMLETIFGVRERYNPVLTFLGMLPSRFNSHSPAQKDNLRELLESYAHMMIRAKITTRSAVAEALAAGRPVWEIGKTSARPAGKEMRQAFDLIVKQMEDETHVA